MSKRIFTAIFAAAIVFTAGTLHAKGQDIIKICSDVEITPDMAVNDVVAVGGNITVSGRVENNVVAVGGSVTLRPAAYVAGEVVVVGGELTKEPGAAIAGKITQVYLPHFVPSVTSFLRDKWLALWATISLLVLLGFLGLAVLLTALIPSHMLKAVDALERSFLKSIMWGIVWMVLVVPIAVMLAISIVGIILIPLEVMLVVLAMIIGYIAAAIFIGKNILASLKKSPPPFIDAVLGIVVLFMIGFVPMVGPVVKALFLAAGFGAVLTTRFGTIK